VITRSVASPSEALNQLYYEQFDCVLFAWNDAEPDGQSLTQFYQYISNARLPMVVLLPVVNDREEAIVSSRVTLSRPVCHSDLYRVLVQLLARV
jgi:hypothetical protein